MIEISSRRAHPLKITEHPAAARAIRLAREPTRRLEETRNRFTHLIRDRDATFTDAFDAVSTSIGIDNVKIAPQCPRMNALAERFVRTARAEPADRMLIAGPRHRCWTSLSSTTTLADATKAAQWICEHRTTTRT